MLTNVAYLAVLPVSQIAAVPENRVAKPRPWNSSAAGSTLVIAAILLSTFGCLNGLILGEPGAVRHGPRRTVLPHLRACHPHRERPWWPLVYQGSGRCSWR